MSDRASILSLPAVIWAKILTFYVEDSILHNRSWKTHLKPLFRCKIASKQLNQLLDDKFFCEYSAGKKMRKMRESFSKLRMHSLIKCNNMQALVDFLNLVQSYELKPAVEQRLIELLPLVIQLRDFPFIKLFFMERRSGSVYPNDVVSKSIIFASERSDDNETLFYVYEKFLPSYGLQKFFPEIKKAIGHRKLDFNTAHGLAEILLNAPKRRLAEYGFIDRFNSLLKDYKYDKQQVVIVPQGELLFMDSIVQSRSFKKQFSNFKIETKKKDSDVVLTYRERSGTKHQIVLGKKEYSTVDKTTLVYTFENFETKNIYELLVRTSLATRIFSSYPQQLIAVTKELLELPYEQQPWFRGIINDMGRRMVAIDSASSAMFFTYSLGNKVVLAFTETNAVSDFKYYPLKHIVLNGENIATHFPPNRFPLGVYNGGRVTGLPEHLIRRAVHEGDLDKVKRLVLEYKVDVKTNQLLSEPDNMLQAYLFKTTKGTANNDMIVWLIENGFDIQRNCVRTANRPHWEIVLVPHLVAKMCDERTIQVLAERFPFDALTPLIKNRSHPVSFETLKIVWKSLSQAITPLASFMQLFLEAVENKKYPQQVHSKKTLVMTAWKHDENCLFRKLPREIVLEILSFDYIDEPPYWEFLEFAEQNGGTQSMCRTDSLLKFIIPFAMHHCDNPKLSNLRKGIAAAIFSHQAYSKEKESEPVLKLMLKFLQRLPESEITSVHANELLCVYSLKSSSKLALSFLKLLLDKKVWAQLRSSTKFPPEFLAAIHGNKPALEILVENEVFTHATLVHFQHLPNSEQIRQFVLELLESKAKKS